MTDFMSEMVVGVNATEFGRAVLMNEVAFKQKAKAKRILLKDFKQHKAMQFPDWDGEPEIKSKTWDYMTPVRSDGAPLTAADIEVVEAYYTAINNDEDFELPEHFGFAWKKSYSMAWYAVVPNEFIKTDIN